MNVRDLEIRKQLGGFAPSAYLSNFAIMHFESSDLASKRLFPICPVDLPSGHFFEFDAGDLARNGVQNKPDYGKVSPTVLGHSKDSYSCQVKQILIGIDKLVATAYQRPSIGINLEEVRTKVVVEQIALAQEFDFAKNFFKKGAWSNEWTGAATPNAAQKKFAKFDKADADPVAFIDERVNDIKRTGRRKPNKLALGADVFVALKNHPAVKERIKYSGTTQNPAVVTEQVFAQILGLDAVVVLDATYNAANVGAPADMKFICDSKSALLLYAPDAPAIDLPSAGYIFSWTFSGSDYITIQRIEGDLATHADFLEGLTAYDIRKTSDALGVFMAECV